MPARGPEVEEARRIEVLPDADAVARAAAARIAEAARWAIEERGVFLLAVSGGSTPWRMLRALVREDVPWKQVHLCQVDERVAPAGHPDRNWTHVCESLVDRDVLPDENRHPMPVETSNLEAAAVRYAATLRGLAGAPPVLDLVHLGLGADGHTASLVPGDPVLEVRTADVAPTAPYQGRRRMTLTFPILRRARLVLWVVAGASKRDALARLRAGDPGIPAGRVRAPRARILADREAAGGALV